MNKEEFLKNEKKRTIISVIIVVLLVILCIGIYLKIDNKKVKTDAIKFKEEYENLNDKKNDDGKLYPTVKLMEHNPFIYVSSKKVIETLKNGTGLIYIGFKQCPWCRNSVNVLQYVGNNKILYLDIKEERDLFEVKDNTLVKTKQGSSEYQEILKILDSILDEYVVEDDNNKEYKTGEKRVYVPLVIGVLNGEIVGYHLGTVDLKEDKTPYDLLDKEEQQQLKEIYDEINNKVYNDTCDIQSSDGC